MICRFIKGMKREKKEVRKGRKEGWKERKIETG